MRTHWRGCDIFRGMNSANPQAPDGLVRTPEVLRLTQRSQSQIRRDVAAGAFPAPLKIGPRAIAWRKSDVAAWIASRPLAQING